MNERVSIWLNRSLRQSNVSKIELAERLGVTPKTVYNWVNGVHTPRRVKIKQIKRVLEEEPGATMIFPPVNHWGDCCTCHLCERCKKRVLRGLPAMCEGLTQTDVDKATILGVLDLVIWWQEDLSAAS